MAPSTLPAKLQRPRVGPQSVPRQRLLDRLDAALGASFTLLSAPAGFGKTSLVAEWISQRAPLPASAGLLSALRAAWLTLDADDNDPVRFWTYVTTAFQAQQVPGLGAPLDDLLASLGGPQPPYLEAIVEMLLHALVTAECDLLLVLDEYQHVRAQPIHDTLFSFISRLPAQAHVVLLTRADPPLPLQRWRVYGQMVELRARDLCFSVEEAGAMLSRRTKIVLPQETIELLLEHTDGWPAGLHLLAASLQGRSAHEVAALVAGFAGSNRIVLNYLLEEVLQSQPAPVRDFLLRTSILSRFNASLCDALLAEEDPVSAGAGFRDGGPAGTSAAILGDLEAANLFLMPLDDNDQWFRYYHLFAEALHAELHRRAPVLDAALHRRAAYWYAAHGCTADAIEQALHAQDFAYAGDILNRCAYRALLAGEFPALYRWTDALPEEVIRARPRLALTRGWLLLFRGPLHTVQSLVDDLADAIGEVGLNDDLENNPAPGEPVALRAMLAAFRWEVRRTFSLCAEAERCFRAAIPSRRQRFTRRQASPA